VFLFIVINLGVHFYNLNGIDFKILTLCENILYFVMVVIGDFYLQ